MNILKSIIDLFPRRHQSDRLPSVLFILKKRDSSWGVTGYTHNSSGLLNSAAFIKDMLLHMGYKADLVEVTDGNDIDREVFKRNPSVVILEAIWCPPAKIRELTSLWHHRNRKWIVRNHSELPFLAMEGIANEWLLEYATIKNTYVACNSPVARKDVELMIRTKYNFKPTVLLLTNYYPIPQKVHHKSIREMVSDEILDVSCFGAIRPLKNHVEQAIAAIAFCERNNLKLRFHVNATRIEGKGDPILKTLRGIFSNHPRADLVEHPWMDRDEFLALCSKMDIGLQVSFSETYNIVGADHVVSGVPIVGSHEIPWCPEDFAANPSSVSDIVEKMVYAMKHGSKDLLEGLEEYNDHTERGWAHSLDYITTPSWETI